MIGDLVAAVQKLDSAIHRVNHYLVDKYWGSQLRYPVYITIIHRSGGGEAAKRSGKYPILATDTEVNNCFSMY